MKTATKLIQKLPTRFTPRTELKDFYFKYELFNDSTYRYQWIVGSRNEVCARCELRLRNAHEATKDMSPLQAVRGIVMIEERKSILAK